MREVEECRSRLIDAAAGSLASAMRKAALTLKQLLDVESGAVRLGAARAILDSAMKLAEVAELERRVQNLESALSEKTA
jgi:hypothetical protein